MKTIKLYRGRKNKQEVGEVIVSDEWYEKLNKYIWGMDKDGYAIRFEKINGKVYCIRMHRVIVGAKEGDITDHIDRNRKNNIPENLRLVSYVESALNRNPMTEEHKVKIGLGGLGKKRTKETCKNISESLKGHVISEETKNKIRNSLIGKVKHSKEVKEKCRQASLKYWAEKKVVGEGRTIESTF